MRLVQRLRRLKRELRGFEPVIRIEISKDALLHNISQLKTLAPRWGIVPVLKANAYGHGIVLVAEIFDTEVDIPFFAVDSYFEAEQLRANGIKKELLVLGYTRTHTIIRNSLRGVAFTVGSLEQLRELQHSARQRVQIKFDTGMHRQGISWESASEVIEIVRATTLAVDGILSHLAESETAGSELTALQLRRWNGIAESFQREFPSIRYYHVANSGGFGHVADIVANAGRSGIALYGIDPGNLRVPFRPALRFLSLVSELRTIEKGESVGYNGTFTATDRTSLATVPAGYFEGVDRRLSNKGGYMVNDVQAPIRGRISMNISSCDVTDVPNVMHGSEVVIISDRPNDPNSVAHIARLCGTIPYEILVHIPAHLRRVVVAR